MENKLIIDYHMEGKQKELEQEAPELAEKAKELFGNEFYYSFPTEMDKLTEESKWVVKMDEKRDEIERRLADTLGSINVENQYEYNSY